MNLEMVVHPLFILNIILRKNLIGNDYINTKIINM